MYFERACIALKHDTSKESTVGILYCTNYCKQNKTNKPKVRVNIIIALH